MSRISCVQVDHFPLEAGLDVAELRRAQLAVKDHHIHVGLRTRGCQLVELTCAEIRRRIRARPLLREAQCHARTSGHRQPRQLVERSLGFQSAMGAAGDETDDGGAFLRGRSYRGHQPDEPSRTGEDGTRRDMLARATRSGFTLRILHDRRGRLHRSLHHHPSDEHGDQQQDDRVGAKHGANVGGGHESAQHRTERHAHER